MVSPLKVLAMLEVSLTLSRVVTVFFDPQLPVLLL